MSLYDTFLQKKSRQNPGPLTAAPKQAQIQSALQTKATGKVAGTSGPKASNIGEAQAFSTAAVKKGQLDAQGQAQDLALQDAAKQVDEQAEAQNEDLDFKVQLKKQGLKNKESLALAKITNQEELSNFRRQGEESLQMSSMSHKANMAMYEIAQKFDFNMKDLTADLAASNKQLDADEQIAQYDQRTHLAAMRSKEYIHRIRQVGYEQRLHAKGAFEQEYQKTAYGKETQRLLQDYEFNEETLKDDNAWAKKMSMQDAFKRINLGMELLADDARSRKFEAGSQMIQSAAMSGFRAWQEAGGQKEAGAGLKGNNDKSGFMSGGDRADPEFARTRDKPVGEMDVTNMFDYQTDLDFSGMA